MLLRTLSQTLTQFFFTFIYRKRVILSFLIVVLTGFTICAIIHDFKKAIFITLVTICVWLYLVWYKWKDYFDEWIFVDLANLTAKLPYKKQIKWIFILLLFVPVFVYVLIESFKSFEQIISVLGLFVLIFISILSSKYPARIKIRPIIVGVYLQCVIALLVLKWPTGKSALDWCMKKAVGFLSNTQHGTTFVYGFIANPPNIVGMDAPFAYTSLPVITFFGALCTLLYYYGVVQWVLIKLAIVLHFTMGTTAAESLNAMASIFLGPTEGAVLIQTSTKSMTQSEIVATMTAGFAMISGSLFAIYISFGACPVYLIAANAMSAPAVLVISKLVYPEVQISKQKEMKSFRFPPCQENSALESLSNGAVQTIKVIAAIIANLIVYVALITMLDTCLSWMGSLVDYPEISFNKLMSWVFYPFAYMLGVTSNHETTMKVAQLIGQKTVLNEFYAYQSMAIMLKNGDLDPRSQMIAIFALCGYSNFSQIGSQIGIFQTFCAKRKKAFVKGAGRAMFAGEIACFMTACIAGAIVSSPTSCSPAIENQNGLVV